MCTELLLESDVAEYLAESQWQAFLGCILWVIGLCCLYNGCRFVMRCNKGDRNKNVFDEFQMGLKRDVSRYTKDKDALYKYQWDRVMTNDDRFDYALSYFMKKYCNNGYDLIDDGGICYDIESIIYEYHDEIDC